MVYCLTCKVDHPLDVHQHREEVVTVAKKAKKGGKKMSKKDKKEKK